MKRSNLKPNPERVRAWLRKSREKAPLARTEALGRSGGRLRAVPPQQVVIPAEMRHRVLARNGGLCVRPGCNRPSVDPHHVLPKQASYFPELALVERNLVGVCRQCHSEHEHGTRRLPRSCLPLQTISMATADPRRWYWLTRLYPEEGA